MKQWCYHKYNGPSRQAWYRSSQPTLCLHSRSSGSTLSWFLLPISLPTATFYIKLHFEFEFGCRLLCHESSCVSICVFSEHMFPISHSDGVPLCSEPSTVTSWVKKAVVSADVDTELLRGASEMWERAVVVSHLMHYLNNLQLCSCWLEAVLLTSNVILCPCSLQSQAVVFLHFSTRPTSPIACHRSPLTAAPTTDTVSVHSPKHGDEAGGGKLILLFVHTAQWSCRFQKNYTDMPFMS